MRRRHPAGRTVLTLGKDGASYIDRKQQIHVAAPKVDAVDTTAAGDTFIGYLLAGLALEKPIEVVLETACRAAALCVTRPGAAESIPTRQELERVTG
jgi:ribokinase